MPDSLLPKLAVLQIIKDYVDKYIDVASRQKTLLLAIRALPKQQAKEILDYILGRDEKGIEQYFYHNHYFVMKFIAREGTWLDSREFVEKQIDDFLAFMQNRTYNKFAFEQNRAYFKSWDRFTKWVDTVTDSSIRLSLLNKLISVVEDKNQEGQFRLDCAVTLGQLGSKKKAVELLLSMANNTTESDVDLHDCVWALVEDLGIKEKAVFKRILLLAEDRAQAVKDWSVYCSVLLELGYKKIYIKDTVMVDRMLSMAEDTTKDESFRSSCVGWLGDAGIKDNMVSDRLFAMARDATQPDLLRRSCAKAIGDLGNKEKALELLLAEAEYGAKRWDDWWRWPEAIATLGFKAKALELLLVMAEDTTQDFVLRADCAERVKYMDVKDKSVALRLLAIAEDITQENNIRARCAEVVGKMDVRDKSVALRLLSTAEDITQENWVRANCAEAGGKLGLKKKAMELLLAVAEDSTVESWIRGNCAHSIVELGIKDKVAVLRLLDAAEDTALNDFDRINFINAVEYLEIKDKKIAHRLLTLAEDTTQDIEFRHSCARAAGKAGEKYKAVNLLAELFLAQPDKSELKAIEIHHSLWDLTDI